ncbi:hypothetical protein TNCV_3826061 [Trichonephila clavipes]|nr:hypothetical protein TNCV_3826061 [Trichonephila clavipes]
MAPELVLMTSQLRVRDHNHYSTAATFKLAWYGSLEKEVLSQESFSSLKHGSQLRETTFPKFEHLADNSTIWLVYSSILREKASPSTNLTRELVARWLFRVPPSRKGTIHLQTSSLLRDSSDHGSLVIKKIWLSPAYPGLEVPAPSAQWINRHCDESRSFEPQSCDEDDMGVETSLSKFPGLTLVSTSSIGRFNEHQPLYTEDLQ